jgi:DNA-binding IscR family transcriptional regulator
MENKQMVLNTLKDAEKPLKSGEIAEKTGLDKKEVDKIIKILKTEELIYSPKNCFYDLKK